ncbi:MAG: YtxH domain-containing protein [Odoribacter sp.]
MKSEDSKLLWGLGVGALVGMAVGYYMTSERRKRLGEDLREMGHHIQDRAKSAYSKAKSKAEEATSRAAKRTEEWAERMGTEAEEWADKAGAKAAGVADDVSQKAKDIRRRMDHTEDMDGKEPEAEAVKSENDGA